MNKFFKFTIVIALTLSAKASAEDGPQPLPAVSRPLEIESDSQDKNLEKDEVNKLVSAAGMLLTAPIGLPFEFLDALQDVGLPVFSVIGYGGAKFGEILYNSAINAGKGIGWFFEGLGRGVVYIIHPDHPEVDLSRYDFKWEEIAGDFESYWQWAQENSGNLVNTWMTKHAYSLVGAELEEAKYPHWGFLRVLSCKDHPSAKPARIEFIASAYQLRCQDALGDKYQVIGIGVGGFFISNMERHYLAILDLNPLGSIEGFYVGSHAGVGLIVGGLVTVAVGEGGAKFILGPGGFFGFGGIAGGAEGVYISKL